MCPPGALRDVFFQLAFGGYVGAFFNLNPFLDRDGYNILVDFLREPRLRSRARRQLAARISGTAEQSDPVLGRYAVAGLIWSTVGAAFAVIFSAQYSARLEALLPHRVALGLLFGFYVLLFVPVLVQLGAPALNRLRFGPRELNRVLE
jgi:putative peptide zinc metalloprotease protein